MVLTQLLAGAGRQRGRDIPVVGERLGQDLRRRGAGFRRREPLRGSAPRRRRSAARRTGSPHPARPPRRGRSASGWPGRRTRCRSPARPASVRAKTFAGRPAAAGAVHPLLPGLDLPARQQRVQVPADPRRGQAQPLGEGRRGGRAVLQQRAGDPVPGRGVSLVPVGARGVHRGGDLAGFHNTSVLLFQYAIQGRSALHGVTLRAPTPRPVRDSARRDCPDRRGGVRLLCRARQAGPRDEGASHDPVRGPHLHPRRRLVGAGAGRGHGRVQAVRRRARGADQGRRRAVPDQHRHHRPGDRGTGR